MKYMALLVLFGLFSCTGTKKQVNVEKETTAFFSKGACFGKCPVYDITIYSDGSYRYVGVKMVTPVGERKGELSEEQFETLKSLLQKDLTSEDPFKKVRDKPITVLKYNNESYRFYSFKTTAERAELNTWFSNFVETIE